MAAHNSSTASRIRSPAAARSCAERARARRKDAAPQLAFALPVSMDTQSASGTGPHRQHPKADKTGGAAEKGKRRQMRMTRFRRGSVLSCGT